MKDLVDREVQGGEGDRAFGLRHFRGSVFLGSWGSVPPCVFLQAVRLKVLMVIVWDIRFGSHLTELNT